MPNHKEGKEEAGVKWQGAGLKEPAIMDYIIPSPFKLSDVGESLLCDPQFLHL